MENETRTTWKDLTEANRSIATTDIKGKQYAQVNQRIKAFRMVHPEGLIETEMVTLDEGVCVFTARVYTEQGQLLATGTAYEKEGSTQVNRTSYIENCETSAVGRALGIAGYGIDVSVASAEEMNNAIHQQEALESIDENKLAVLRDKLKAAGKSEEACAEAYGKPLDLLTVSEWMDLTRKLDIAISRREQSKERENDRS